MAECWWLNYVKSLEEFPLSSNKLLQEITDDHVAIFVCFTIMQQGFHLYLDFASSSSAGTGGSSDSSNRVSNASLQESFELRYVKPWKFLYRLLNWLQVGHCINKTEAPIPKCERSKQSWGIHVILPSSHVKICTTSSYLLRCKQVTSNNKKVIY